MRTKKAKPKREKPRPVPQIHITGLSGRSRDFDFMPNLVENDSIPEDQRKMITQLKDGTYQPFMGAVEYEAEIDPKTHFLIKATPKTNIYQSTSLDKFDYSAEIEKLTTKVKPKNATRLDIISKAIGDKNMPVMVRYYHNPLQYFDHILLADGYTNSFAGTVIDVLTDFIMPKKLKPHLILRNPDKHGDAMAQQKVIEANQEIIEKLEEVDKWYSDDGPVARDSYIDVPLMAKFKAMITHHLVFGRCAMVFERWENLPHFKEDGGKEYEDIPNALKVLHPIDMGMVEVDPYTWKVGGLYLHNNYPFIKAADMIYLINKYHSPLIGSFQYGFSAIERSIDPVRLLRRIFAQNYPQFIRTSYSGMGAFLFDSTQYSEDIRDAIRTKILSTWKAGEIAVIDYANIKDFEFKEFKINPEISGLIQLHESLIKVIVSIIGMPQSLIFDEAGGATRATLVGRVVSFINNQVTQYRSSIGEQVATQWYMRNFRILYADQPEKLKMFSVGVEFEEMDLETKTEKVERLLLESQLNPIKDEHIAEELNDPSYLDNIDKDKKAQQEKSQFQNDFNKMPIKPTGNKGVYKVTDADTGQTSHVQPQR